MKTVHRSATPAVDAGPAAKATMRAIVQDGYGEADTLRLAVVDRPQLADNDVLLHVRAAGLNRGVWHLMTGKPYLLRLVYGLRRPSNPVPGQDVAGTVVAVGSAVTRFSVGDEVFGTAKGSFAEYAAARQDSLALRPASLSAEQAAVVGVSAVTAIQALCDVGSVKAGQQVLVTGASGGIGSYAVQLASALGATVTGVCSAAKMQWVRSLGAQHVLDYRTDDFADGSHHYDLILDIAGLPTLRRLRRALSATGTLVLVGGEGGGTWTGGTIGRQLRARTMSLFRRQRLTSVLGKQRGVDLDRLATFFDAGTVVPAIDKTYGLADVPEAMRYFAAGRVRGKVAVSM